MNKNIPDYCKDTFRKKENVRMFIESIERIVREKRRSYGSEYPIPDILEPPYLKPCPFCGGEAEIKRGATCGGHGDYGPDKWVQCTNEECGIRTQKYFCDGYYGCDITDEELAEKWNKRV